MNQDIERSSDKVCQNCSKKSVTFIRYSGAHLCEEHFNEFLISRVKREMRKQGKLPPGTRLVAAVSGGKDSITMLMLLHDIFTGHRDLELLAVSVDEGINPYRTESLRYAEAVCNKLGIEHRTVMFKSQFGFTLDEIVKKEIPDLQPCSFCGVWRRTCLNVMAKELSADRVATGHNLDDNSQSILMNFCKGDYNKLFRLGPHRVIKPGLIPRQMPLRVIPEKEIYLYTLLNNIEVHKGECPYSEHAQRRIYRKIINQLEDQQPGSRHAILNMYDQLYTNMESQFSHATMNVCETCGEPASGDQCKSCQMLVQITRIDEEKSKPAEGQ